MPTYTRTYGGTNDYIAPPQGYNIYVIDGGAGTDTLFADTGSAGFTMSAMDAAGVVTVTGASGTVLYLTNVEKMTFKDGKSLTLPTAPAIPTNISGTSGNDSLSGNTANNVVDGGAGTDTLAYTKAITNYTITRTGSGYTVRDNAGSDGTDTLANVERVQFSDKIVNLTVQANAGTIAAGDLKLLEELYVAFFNRVPDADGLEYWIVQRKDGKSINQIAESFYSAGVQYSSLTGFSSTMTNADFVNTIYRNVLGRTNGADAEGLAYWSKALADGTETHGSLVSTIINTAHTYKGDATWGWVANLLDNKGTVAHLAAVSMGINYLTPDEAVSQGMKIAAAVSATDTTAAIALIGVPPAQLVL